MNSLILLFSLVFIAINSISGGIITHHEGLEDGHHERATSYQNIHIEHFHPVPTFIKKEHKHLLEHPISIGKSSSKVEIHHGGKHDHGYAIATIENDLHSQHQGGLLDFGHDHNQGQQELAYQLQGQEEAYHQGVQGQEETYQGVQGQEETYQGVQGHEGLSSGGAEGYQVHDQGVDYAQYQGQQGADEVSLGHATYEDGADLGQYQLAGAPEGYHQEEGGTQYETHQHAR